MNYFSLAAFSVTTLVLSFAGAANAQQPATTNADVIAMPATSMNNWTHNGQSDYVIVTADEPFPIAAYAAKELALHLELATGAKLPILAESKVAANQTKRLYIGSTKAAGAVAKIDVEKLAPEVCVLKTVGDDLFIVGKDGPGHELDFGNIHSGTLWGVYEVLERTVNARWLWPGEGGIAVTHADSLRAPRFDSVVKPPLETRVIRTYVPWDNGNPVVYDQNMWGQKSGLAYSSDEAFRQYLFDQQAFMRRQRLGTSRVPNASVGHDFIHWWEEYGKTHPEWFQLIPAAEGEFANLPQQERARLAYGRPEKTWKGKRGPDTSESGLFSMCVSNKGLQREIVHRWQEERKKNPSAEIRVGENDIWGLCVCDECVALDDPQISAEEKAKLPGSVGGLYYPFNAGRRYAIFYQHLHEMASKIDPNVRVLGYIYLNYFVAPKDVKLHPNIILSFVPWGGFYYPRDPREQIWLREQWQQWRDLGATIFYRPNFVLGGGSMPDNYQHQMTDQFDFYLRHGLIGTDFDARVGQWAAQGVSLYALMRKHTRPEKTTEGILEEYYSAFGPGALYVKAMFDFWENHSVENATLHNDVWGKHSASQLITHSRVAGDFYPSASFERAGEFLAAAKKAIEAQPDARNAEYLRRVEYLRLGMEHSAKIAALSRLFGDKDVSDETRRAAFKDLAQFRRKTETLGIANYAQSAADEMRSFSDRYNFDAKVEVEIRPAD